MKNLILELAINVPHGFPWRSETGSKGNDKIFEEVKRTLRNLKLNSFEARKEASWKVERIIYESMVYSESIEELIKNIENKFKALEKPYNEFNKDSIKELLKFRRVTEDTQLSAFKRLINKTTSSEDIKEYASNIKEWITQIYSWNTLLDKKCESIVKLSSEVFKEISKNYENIGITEDQVLRLIKNKILGNDRSLMLFIKTMGKDINSYQKFIKTVNEQGEDNVKEIKNPESLEVKKDSLEDTLEGLFASMDSKEQKNKKNEVKQKSKLKTKPKEVKKVEQCVETKVDDDINKDEVYLNLSKLAKSLGYEVIDKNHVKVSKEYYEKMSVINDNNEIKIIKELLSTKTESILSQLYNIYKNINNTDTGNIEATMANFFLSLFDMGFEVEDDEHKVGDRITVNTKDALKDFILSRSASEDGELTGEIQHLSWKYKDEVIMPKIIKPIE